MAILFLEIYPKEIIEGGQRPGTHMETFILSLSQVVYDGK